MRFSTVLLLGLMIISITLSFSSALQPITTSTPIPPMIKTGFIAPLHHWTSPRSPFYNPNATREDLQRESTRISAHRNRYFSKKLPTTSGPGGMPTSPPPISHDFVMEYNIGTPLAKVFGVPDTSSALIWLQCQPCTSCYPQTTPLYDSRKSFTYKEVACASQDCQSTNSTCQPGPGDEDQKCYYGVHYDDQTFSEGVIAKETFSYDYADHGDSNSTTPSNSTVIIGELLFGCGTYNSDGAGSAGRGSSGIVGLQNGSTISLLSQLSTPSFSYCLNVGETGSSSIRFGSAALLNLGGSTPLLTSSYGPYDLALEDFSVGGELLNISEDLLPTADEEETGFIIDTGSTYTLLNSNVYDKLLDAVKDYMNDQDIYSDFVWELCYVDITDVPEIVFQFTGLSLPLRDDNVWVDGPGGLHCLAMQRTPHQLCTFGMYQQRNLNVGFDLINSQLWMQYQNNCP